jgi:hypothetical protein
MIRKVDIWDILPGQRSRGKSIYYVFIEEGTNRCRICEMKKTSLYRAIACVRTHLQHRPFKCLGASMACKTCGPQMGYVHSVLWEPVASYPTLLGVYNDKLRTVSRDFTPRLCWLTISRHRIGASHVFAKDGEFIPWI